MFLIIHGGAGIRKPSRAALRKLFQSLSSGYGMLAKGRNALEAVVESITILEDSGLFNAGSGGHLQSDGIRRLDASLMDGNGLKAGSVVGIEGIRNPIQAARHVMDTPHVMLTNRGAKEIAKGNNLVQLPRPDRELVSKLKRRMQRNRTFSGLYDRYFSTVGAVAIDRDGNVASGASTGGLCLMLPGRVGDTPVIGAGVYADNALGAVACTGTGEDIIRLSMAKEISMRLDRMTPYRSACYSLSRLLDLGGEAGVIVINTRGKFTMLHTTPYMASGYANRKGILVNEGFQQYRPRF